MLRRQAKKVEEKFQNQDVFPVSPNWRGGKNGLFSPPILHVPFLNQQKRITTLGMRSSRVVGASDYINGIVATVLGSITASSDTVESERRQMKQC